MSISPERDINSSDVMQSEQPDVIMESFHCDVDNDHSIDLVNNNSSQLEPSFSEEASHNPSESQPVSGLACTGRIDKRRKGGRKTNGSERFASFEEVHNPRHRTKRAKYKCCEKNMNFVAWNSNRAMKHFIKCDRFKCTFPAAYESFIAEQISEEASKAESSRRSRESIRISTSSHGVRVSNMEKFTKEEHIDRFFSSFTPKKRNELDRYFANAIINDGAAFTTCASSNWSEFWKCAFGGAWKPPYRDRISGTLLDESFNEKKAKVIEALSNVPALCISVDGFTDVNSCSLFNMMAGGPLPFVAHTFRLEGKRESAQNMDKAISNAIKTACGNFNKKEKVLGFVSDSPNVMTATRKLLCGARSGGSNCVVFSYGCLCHALSNFVKDICKIQFVKETLTKTIKLAQLFRNTHVANDLLAKERNKLDDAPQTIKSYSVTRWNGVAVLCRSVIDNKELIASVFSNQKMCDQASRSLDLRSNSKASEVMSFATEGEYWSALEKITPLFQFVNYLVTFLEGDTIPISYAPLSFLLISESLKHFNLPDNVVDAAEVALKSRFSTIVSDVHALAVVLDPSIPKSRWNSTFPFFEIQSGHTFYTETRNAFAKLCNWLNFSDIETSEVNSHFQMVLGSKGTVMKRCSSNSTAYHPQLWWAIDGQQGSEQLSTIAQCTFALFPSGAPTERSFKTRSHVHTKTRNRLSDEKSDKQSFVVFNSHQLDRVNTALNTTRSTVVDRCLANGLVGEDGKEMIRISGKTDLNEDGFDGDICTQLIDVSDLEIEFEALLTIE